MFLEEDNEENDENSPLPGINENYEAPEDDIFEFKITDGSDKNEKKSKERKEKKEKKGDKKKKNDFGEKKEKKEKRGENSKESFLIEDLAKRINESKIDESQYPPFLFHDSFDKKEEKAKKISPMEKKKAKESDKDEKEERKSQDDKEKEERKDEEDETEYLHKKEEIYWNMRNMKKNSSKNDSEEIFDINSFEEEENGRKDDENIKNSTKIGRTLFKSPKKRKKEFNEKNLKNNDDLFIEDDSPTDIKDMFKESQNRRFEIKKEKFLNEDNNDEILFKLDQKKKIIFGKIFGQPIQDVEDSDEESQHEEKNEKIMDTENIPSGTFEDSFNGTKTQDLKTFSTPKSEDKFFQQKKDKFLSTMDDNDEILKKINEKNVSITPKIEGIGKGRSESKVTSESDKKTSNKNADLKNINENQNGSVFISPKVKRKDKRKENEYRRALQRAVKRAQSEESSFKSDSEMFNEKRNFYIEVTVIHWEVCENICIMIGRITEIFKKDEENEKMEEIEGIGKGSFLDIILWKRVMERHKITMDSRFKIFPPFMLNRHPNLPDEFLNFLPMIRLGIMYPFNLEKVEEIKSKESSNPEKNSQKSTSSIDSQHQKNIEDFIHQFCPQMVSFSDGNESTPKKGNNKTPIEAVNSLIIERGIPLSQKNQI